MVENSINTDPARYFKFQCCAQCSRQPCNRLRFGGVRPGKFCFVYTRHFGLDMFDCPFESKNVSEVEMLLEQVSLSELIQHLDDVLFHLSPLEQFQFNQNHYVNNYLDRFGRLRFIEALRQNKVLSVLRVPNGYEQDSSLRSWLQSYEGYEATVQREKTEEKVDEPEETPIADSKKKLEDLSIRLPIDPNSDESKDDTFTLYSEDSKRSYKQTKTVKDDQVAGDNYTDLKFTDLDSSLSYTLEVDPGKEGKPYSVFKNRPFGKWNN